MLTALCPCGRALAFSQCCEPYLLNQSIAPTAEALMRSRYTAFATGNIDYLLATHKPVHSTGEERLQLHQTMQQTRWRSLTILSTQLGQPQDSTGYVEFMAVFQIGLNLGQLHERSTFKQHMGRWFYTDGEILPPFTPKRNQPCWCGSGKKFKHCHGTT